MKCGIILESETIALAIVDDNGEFVFSETSALGDSYNGLLSQIAATGERHLPCPLFQLAYLLAVYICIMRNVSMRRICRSLTANP